MASTSFGEFVAKHLASADLNQKLLAQRLSVSAALVSQWINGKRRPTAETVESLANLFELEGAERKKFFDASETRHALPTAGAVIAKLQKSLSDRSKNDAVRTELLSRVDAAHTQWKKALSKAVRWCVIPTAGWQTRLLGRETVADLVERVARDALEADLEKVVVVLGKDGEIYLPKIVRKRVTFARQDEPKGTGHAVQTGLQQANVPLDEPFAVFFPDERVVPNVVKEMVAMYNERRDSVIAFRYIGAEDLDKFGSVTVKHIQGREYQIVDAKETTKRGRSPRRPAIVGRYVFSPIAWRLLGIRDNLHREVSLTSTVAQLTRGNRVIGFEIRDDEFLSIVSERRQLESKLKEFICCF